MRTSRRCSLIFCLECVQWVELDRAGNDELVVLALIAPPGDTRSRSPSFATRRSSRAALPRPWDVGEPLLSEQVGEHLIESDPYTVRKRSATDVSSSTKPLCFERLTTGLGQRVTQVVRTEVHLEPLGVGRRRLGLLPKCFETMVEAHLQDSLELGVVETQPERFVDESQQPTFVGIAAHDEFEPVEVPLEWLVLDAVLGGDSLGDLIRSGDASR